MDYVNTKENITLHKYTKAQEVNVYNESAFDYYFRYELLNSCLVYTLQLYMKRKQLIFVTN